MLGFAWLRFNAIQQQGARKNEYTCLWCFLPSCWNTSRFTVTVKSTVTHSNFRHCRVSFSPFLRQPFSKQRYKTSRINVAVHLFSKRSQKMSKCGKNISDTLVYWLTCHIFVLITFWRHLWSVTDQQHKIYLFNLTTEVWGHSHCLIVSGILTVHANSHATSCTREHAK